MAERISKEEQLSRIMDGLKCSRQEAEEIYNYDKAVDKGETSDYDFTPEQKKISQKMTRADRKPKAPTAYKFDKRERKADTSKEGIIQDLCNYLSGLYDNVEIVNKSREVSFSANGEKFSMTLVRKRK